MKIVGYADRLSARPGDRIRFMVSCELESYRADIVRLIHGDENPEGPGFKEELVSSAVSGEYPGRPQSFQSGSYVSVPDSPSLRLIDSFTLQAWIYPTTPDKGVQGILTKWSGADGPGYGLFVDEDGSLALWLGDGSGTLERLSSGVSLRPAQWYFVAAVYDAQAQRVFLYQRPVAIWPRDESQVVIELPTQLRTPGESNFPFLVAGHWGRGESRKSVVTGHFNGKIDSPRVFGRALNPEEIEIVRGDAPPAEFGEAVIAAWDFGRDFSSAIVTDTSSNGLNGRVVNMPARGMTGHNWKGDETDFRNAPDEYSAIYFHDDDLEDAKWEVSFELTIPEEMRSGVYAARLRSGDQEDYIPWFVRPKRGASSAPILFLAPTASYLAYANSHLPADPIVRAWRTRQTGGDLPFEYPVLPQDKYILEHNLMSLYDRHTDGSGVCYSSRLRPIVSMRPKYVATSLGLGKGAPHQFNADLHLLDWMETKGHEYDVITDEDLHFEGEDLLAPYPVVVTGSHPEYWSAQMLDSLESYLAKGGRLMYLGGNGFYWVTSFDSERPHVIEIRRWRGTETWEADPGEFHHSTTGEIGGLWRFRGRPPQKLTGVGFSAQGFDYSVPFQRGPGSFDPRAAFIFEGVDDGAVIGDAGLVMGGAGGFEVDRADSALGTPPHALVMASASGFSDGYQHVVEEVLLSDSKQGGTVNPLVRGDMVYFEGPKGGAVFSVGSIAWCGSLSHNDYDNDVSRITENVLRRFVSEDPID